MATQITLEGKVIAPLNITEATPGLDLAGFKFATLGDRLSALAAAPAKPSDAQQRLTTEHQAPSSGEEQLKEQIHQPGGPGSQPQSLLPFPLQHFKGTYAGNGFNLIWVPAPFKTLSVGPDGPNDNKLFLNLTTEQLTFGPSLGAIPNRGFGSQPDIHLGGLAYLQTVQNTTNESTGKGDKPRSSQNSGIHFEPGVWVHVPAANFHEGNPKRDSIARMASIPHGTTINAQGFVPAKDPKTIFGGKPGGPIFETLDTTPFTIGNPSARAGIFRTEMTAERPNSLREPSDLTPFIKTGRITSEIIKNPNIVLKNALDTSGLKVLETITFKVATGLPSAQLNGGGTANISFLAGKQASITTASPGAADQPNAHAEVMESTFYIERVEYDVVVDKMNPGETQILFPTMPAGARAPTPRFAVTAPRVGGVKERKTIKVWGVQIQYSQNVSLNFGPRGNMLTWPHISVATLVPTDPQVWRME